MYAEKNRNAISRITPISICSDMTKSVYNTNLGMCLAASSIELQFISARVLVLSYRVSVKVLLSCSLPYCFYHAVELDA